jgi:DNA repair exonuclease SbcCD ATPase subunit
MTAPNAEGGRWRLASITVRQFRGVAKERRFEFNGRPGLLHGNNGVGKSTVALALQWTLFGRFPDGVLPNTAYDRFLSPIQAKGKQYSGEVVLSRGREKLVVSRDGESKEFKLQLGDTSWAGPEAEERRDALLGLDMDSFVRVVLLQQSRIRALLLDDPKERNKALDRLLGMDAVEHLLEVIKPREYTKAADAWREQILSGRQRFEERERLLAEQLEGAQQRARNLKFLNKDLNPTGLRTRYAELGGDLVALGRKYGLALTDLPPCAGPAQIGAVSRAFQKGLQSIRVNSELKQRLSPVEASMATLAELREGWSERLTRRDAARAVLEKLVAAHGEEKGVLEGRVELEGKLKDLQRQLKAANALRELLVDALAFVERGRPGACPVCEQPLPERLDLASRLEKRTDSLASEDIARLQATREKAETRLAQLSEALDRFKEGRADLDACQKELERQRQKAVDATGGTGIAENKVATRLDEALAKREEQRKQLGAGIAAMEQDLEAIDLRERALREGLVPVVEKRDELARHEEDGKKAKALHERDEARARRMESLAAQLEAIRKALLDAKQELAAESLRKAGPRAQELYGKLVRHPVFDTLEIQTTPKASKVDYTFTVSAKGSSATSRDARLVLSDGQLTATAVALFFGLAESTGHELDLLYVDDPTQNLDLPSKEAMARAIAELSRRRQLIVSTQDEDFVSFLETAGFRQEAVIHHLKAWDGNPTVETVAPA